ncbi:metallophosphoesterase [Thioclava sp. GXIMD4216]|uniref:metallophosphoesterase family protein n=1 Tax=Thioclava sp. GXIMD4216 TaxID=3131929 RepID=UPI0030D01EBB
MTFRFIHASDLHIGRRFANLPEGQDTNLRGRLMEARHNSLVNLAQAARAQGARDVLLAGDTFDTPTPSAALLRQAVGAMQEAQDITWWLLPGNHDNLREAEPLWESLTREAPANLRALTESTPQEMTAGVFLLPAPIRWRAQADDPSVGLSDMVTPEGARRVGLAHGGITDFTEGGGTIAPDRDIRAGLDYLALGDWHGRMAVSARTHYSGTPEQDRFKHNRRGLCLSVTLGDLPQVEEIETGQFLWQDLALDLTPLQDSAEALQQVLPATGRRDILMRLNATGWTTLPGQFALQEAAKAQAPDFAYFRLRDTGLSVQYAAEDLDDIDHGGALRHAAETLRTEFGDERLDQAARLVAGDALARLYAYMREDTP